MAITFIVNPAIEAEIKIDPQIGAAMMRVGQEALASAQANAPVATGRLKGSLRVERISGNGARVSVNVDYWLFPEYGTAYMPAEPYLRPALSAVGLNLT